MSAKRGALSTISWVMPVSAWIDPGIVLPGLTSVDHCAVRAKPLTSRTAISVTRSLAGSEPVVSTSTMASGPFMDVYTVAHFGDRRLSKIRYAFCRRTFSCSRQPWRLHAHAMGQSGCGRGSGARRRAGLPPGRRAGGELPQLLVPASHAAGDRWARPDDLAFRRLRRSLRPA